MGAASGLAAGAPCGLVALPSLAAAFANMPCAESLPTAGWPEGRPEGAAAAALDPSPSVPKAIFSQVRFRVLLAKLPIHTALTTVTSAPTALSVLGTAVQTSPPAVCSLRY